MLIYNYSYTSLFFGEVLILSLLQTFTFVSRDQIDLNHFLHLLGKKKNILPNKIVYDENLHAQEKKVF